MMVEYEISIKVENKISGFKDLGKMDNTSLKPITIESTYNSRKIALDLLKLVKAKYP